MQHTHTHMHTHIHTNAHTYPHTNNTPHTPHTHTHMHARTHTHTHAHTHTHTHTQTPWLTLDTSSVAVGCKAKWLHLNVADAFLVHALQEGHFLCFIVLTECTIQSGLTWKWTQVDSVQDSFSSEATLIPTEYFPLKQLDWQLGIFLRNNFTTN